MQPFITNPHGQHEVKLLDDDPKPANRIYEIRDRSEPKVLHILGSELESLFEWWQAEQARAGQESSVN